VERSLNSLPGAASGAFIRGDQVVARDADRVAPTASIIKLFIAGTIYEQLAAGRLQPGETLTVRQSDVVGGTGILLTQVGSTHTLEEMVEIMLLHSDNTASNMLIDRLGGFAPVNRFIDGQGLTGNTRLNRKLLDTEAQRQGRENTSTARDVAAYLQRLLRGEVVNATASARILGILRQRGQTDRDWLLRNFPADVGGAHISGILPGVRNDAVLMTGDAGPYILVVFVQQGDEAAAERAIARVGREIHDAAATR
jgi:beta-lactamase class A